MEIITVISPDKLSMTMFCDYYRSIYVGDRNLEILDINCIFSKDVQGYMIKEFISLNKDVDYLIIKYKTKLNTVLSLPPEVEKYSNYIVQFDMFSNHPNLLKDSDDRGKKFVEQYNINIDKMNKLS